MDHKFEEKEVKLRHADGTISNAMVKFCNLSEGQTTVKVSNSVMCVSANNWNFFYCLLKIRMQLELEEIQIMCNGAAKNVYPSFMCLDMGYGRTVYKTTIGQATQVSDLIDIFDCDNNLEFVSIEEQKKYYDEWTIAPKDSQIIKFYKINEEFGCFSNFSAYGFELDGEYWQTSEHYFQAQKFKNRKLKEIIRNAKTPTDAAKLGRSRSFPLRKDWEKIKENVMKKALHAKFTAHMELKQTLISTFPKVIIENTSDDYYWGCGTNGNGQNRLGVLLMEIREALRGDSDG